MKKRKRRRNDHGKTWTNDVKTIGSRSRKFTELRDMAKSAIFEIKTKGRNISDGDRRKYLSLVYYYMADECGLVPHGSELVETTLVPIERIKAEDETIDHKQQWARQVIITFGKHNGKELKDVPRDYLQWIIKQDGRSPYFRELQDASRLLLT